MGAHIEPAIGAPCWVSLAVSDRALAEDFYGKVLGWSFQQGALGSEFAVARHGGVPVAGIGATVHSLNLPVAWIPFFAVPDLDEAASRISERAATVAVGPLKLGHGRALMAADPDGARFGLWQGQVLPSWHAGYRHPPARLDLRTRDAFAAAMFYGEVLDWAQEENTCDVDYAEDTVRIWAAGHLVATLFGGSAGLPPDPEIRPRWDVSFYVDDPDAAVEAGVAYGADASAVPAPLAAPTGRAVTLTDPEGALFTVRPWEPET